MKENVAYHERDLQPIYAEINDDEEAWKFNN